MKNRHIIAFLVAVALIFLKDAKFSQKVSLKPSRTAMKWSIIAVITVLVMHFFMQQFSSPANSTWWILILLTPFWEEVLFRGICIGLPTLHWPNKKWTWMFVAALLFGLFHFQRGIIIIIWTFVQGLVYGIAYIKSDNLLPPMLAHAVNNYYAM